MGHKSKVLSLALASTIIGILSVCNNVKADDDNANEQSLIVNNSAPVASYDLYSNQLAQVNTDVRYGDQGIYIPQDFTLQNITNVDDPSSAQVLQNQVKKDGLENNNYQSNPIAAAQRVDINNLSDQQVSAMNSYALGLINQIRYEMGVEPFSQNQGSINTVKKMALQYQDKRESLLNGYWHDPEILQNHSENISAFQIYADHIAGLGFKTFASAKGYEFESDSNVPLLSVTTMDDLRAMIYYGVMGMLFNDASDQFGHAKNFLTYSQPINDMAVYPSLLYQINDTGRYSDGTPFSFQVENVDMHFIWADASNDYHWDLQAGKWYYVDTTTNDYVTGLQHINGQTYYLADDGVMQTGWQFINNSWYYFEQSGAAATGWRFINGHWYYFNNAGVADTNWNQINAHWYYFDPINAWANTNWQYLDNSWYYFDPTNAWMDTGWRWLGAWYYFNLESGQMTTGLANINSSYYNFANSGAMQKGWWLINNNWYYFQNNGAASMGWYRSAAGLWYYFDLATGQAKVSWQYINGHWYYFDPTNAWMLTGWQYINGHWYYFDPVNGDMKSGLQWIHGHLYYLQTVHNGYFGAMQTGWQLVNNHWLFFNQSGAAS